MFWVGRKFISIILRRNIYIYYLKCTWQCNTVQTKVTPNCIRFSSKLSSPLPVYAKLASIAGSLWWKEWNLTSGEESSNCGYNCCYKFSSYYWKQPNEAKWSIVVNWYVRRIDCTLQDNQTIVSYNSFHLYIYIYNIDHLL
jgi:hypothetical protein